MIDIASIVAVNGTLIAFLAVISCLAICALIVGYVWDWWLNKKCYMGEKSKDWAKVDDHQVKPKSIGCRVRVSNRYALMSMTGMTGEVVCTIDNGDVSYLGVALDDFTGGHELVCGHPISGAVEYSGWWFAEKDLEVL